MLTSALCMLVTVDEISVQAGATHPRVPKKRRSLVVSNHVGSFGFLRKHVEVA